MVNVIFSVLKMYPAGAATSSTVYVPLFVEQGDKIQIDTRSGEYLGRAK